MISERVGYCGILREIKHRVTLHSMENTVLTI